MNKAGEFKECLYCKAHIFPTNRSYPFKKYCSKRCREKHWIEINREKLNANVRRYRRRRYVLDGKWRDEGKKARELKGWMQELKSKPCTDCGVTFPICCMDFDHRIGETKQYNIGSMFAHHYSKQLIQIELDKCDLVCSNCHRVRTQKRKLGSGVKYD